jgi:MoaA/NifB/PqqE/SkfB family radical SAM enzyme
MSPIIESLPVLVLYPHSRCNCRCLMCDIWKNTTQDEVRKDELERYLDEVETLSVQWIVLSGGEPLMHSGLFQLADAIRRRGIRVTVLSTGLLLEREAARLIDSVDDLIISIDGPAALHDKIRRVPGAFSMLERGTTEVLRRSPNFKISGRCTVQRENYFALNRTAQAAQDIGLCSISFLAADVTSEAFNRFQIWDATRQNQIALTESEIAALEREMAALDRKWAGTGFIAENRQKLERIVQHFRAHLGLAEAVAPNCNAPWFSAVVEADGTVRPCFFHPPVGSARNQNLLDVLNGPVAVEFRQNLDVASNPICQRCVCSLNWKTEPRA